MGLQGGIDIHAWSDATKYVVPNIYELAHPRIQDTGDEDSLQSSTMHAAVICT